MTRPDSPSPMEPPDDAFFRALERRRTQALVERTMEVLEALHAPDYQLVTPAGRVFARKEYLGLIEREPFYAGWDIGEMRCRITERMAAVRYRATLLFPSGRRVLCWHTDLYEKRDDGWQAVWSQATEIRESTQQAPDERPA